MATYLPALGTVLAGVGLRAGTVLVARGEFSIAIAGLAVTGPLLARAAEPAYDLVVNRWERMRT